jgi:hypothetical protein
LVSRLQRRIFLCCAWVKNNVIDPKFHANNDFFVFDSDSCMVIREITKKNCPKKYTYIISNFPSPKY